MTASGSGLALTSSVTDGSDSITVSLNTLGADAGNTIGGGLALLDDLDVSTGTGAVDALGRIESLLTIATDAAAGFGSDQNRLQALQVQQQLATQALSIANSAPQSLLGLFR